MRLHYEGLLKFGVLGSLRLEGAGGWGGVWG